MSSYLVRLAFDVCLCLLLQLKRDGDKLMGRGVTDCLGHVALVTEMFRSLGKHKPALKRSVIGVFIANEENSRVCLHWLHICPRPEIQQLRLTRSNDAI